MGRKRDWAETLARLIISEVQGTLDAEHREQLLVARLRLVRQEGIGIGIEQVREALKR